jgi:hypothetical protein
MKQKLTKFVSSVEIEIPKLLSKKHSTQKPRNGHMDHITFEQGPTTKVNHHIQLKSILSIGVYACSSSCPNRFGSRIRRSNVKKSSLNLDLS